MPPGAKNKQVVASNLPYTTLFGLEYSMAIQQKRRLTLRFYRTSSGKKSAAVQTLRTGPYVDARTPIMYIPPLYLSKQPARQGCSCGPDAAKFVIFFFPTQNGCLSKLNGFLSKT